MSENRSHDGSSAQARLPSSDPVLLVERDSYIETWTLNIPRLRNPVTDQTMVDAIVSAVDNLSHSQVRCVIITGAGTAFSSGGNISDIAEGKGYFGAAPYAQVQGYRRGIQRIPAVMETCDVPFIAAVNGPAIGAGFDLALLCDLRIASRSAIFAESFVKLGLVPGDGGAWLLPRIIGHARAMEMTLTGDRIDASTALDWGLVSRVVEPDELLNAARQLAARITVNPPMAVQMAKRLVRDGRGQTLPSLLDMSATMQAIAHTTADHKEAVSALLDRRVGDFSGT